MDIWKMDIWKDNEALLLGSMSWLIQLNRNYKYNGKIARKGI